MKLFHIAKPMAWMNCGLDQGMKVVPGWWKLLHPAKPIAWINCGLDEAY